MKKIASVILCLLVLVVAFAGIAEMEMEQYEFSDYNLKISFPLASPVTTRDNYTSAAAREIFKEEPVIAYCSNSALHYNVVVFVQEVANNKIDFSKLYDFQIVNSMRESFGSDIEISSDDVKVFSNEKFYHAIWHSSGTDYDTSESYWVFNKDKLITVNFYYVSGARPDETIKNIMESVKLVGKLQIVNDDGKILGVRPEGIFGDIVRFLGSDSLWSISILMIVAGLICMAISTFVRKINRNRREKKARQDEYKRRRRENDNR